MAYKKFYENEQWIDCEEKRIFIVLLQHVLDNVYNPLITYGDLARRVGYSTGHGTLDAKLGNISSFCEANGLPRISAVVINKLKNKPGNGFFKYFYGDISEAEEWKRLGEEFNGIIKNKNELKKMLCWLKTGYCY